MTHSTFRPFFRSGCLLFTILLCLSLFVGCTKKKPQESLVITVDQNERLLYRDDTAITLTVQTPKDCTQLDVAQLGGSSELYATWLNDGAKKVYQQLEQDPLFYTEPKQTISFVEEKASVTETDTHKNWTVTVDYGNDGVYGLLISAQLANGEILSQKAPVYVRYPEINMVQEGVAAAWESYILRDSNEPFYFVVNLANTKLDYKSVSDITQWGALVLSHLDSHALYCTYEGAQPDTFEQTYGISLTNPWEIKFASDSPVYGETVLWDTFPMQLLIWMRSFAGEFTSIYPIDNMNFPTGDLILCQIAETDTEHISISTRTAVSYLHQQPIDETLYPEAAKCLEIASLAIEEIIKPDMTEYEKVKAIHDWMLDYGKNIRHDASWDAMNATEQVNAIKTAYGFLSGYGGDCMGWSDTFYLLCSMADISCSTVSALGEPGGAQNGGFIANHRFNIAQIENKLYYFDVYWDGAGSNYDSLPYTYFCMTSEQAAKSHTWTSPEHFGPPIASDTTYLTDAETGELLQTN